MCLSLIPKVEPSRTVVVVGHKGENKEKLLITYSLISETDENGRFMMAIPFKFTTRPNFYSLDGMKDLNKYLSSRFWDWERPIMRSMARDAAKTNIEIKVGPFNLLIINDPHDGDLTTKMKEVYKIPENMIQLYLDQMVGLKQKGCSFILAEYQNEEKPHKHLMENALCVEMDPIPLGESLDAYFVMHESKYQMAEPRTVDQKIQIVVPDYMCVKPGTKEIEQSTTDYLSSIHTRSPRGVQMPFVGEKLLPMNEFFEGITMEKNKDTPKTQFTMNPDVNYYVYQFKNFLCPNQHFKLEPRKESLKDEYAKSAKIVIDATDARERRMDMSSEVEPKPKRSRIYPSSSSSTFQDPSSSSSTFQGTATSYIRKSRGSKKKKSRGSKKKKSINKKNNRNSNNKRKKSR